MPLASAQIGLPMVEGIPGFPPHVGAALSLRGEPPHGFNLGDHVGDDPERVAAHREQFAAAIGARPTWLQQVHGTRVVELQGNESAGSLACDAAWTRRPAVACTIMTADCIPVLVSHGHQALVGAAHAGWRGLAGGVIEGLLSQMMLAAQAARTASATPQHQEHVGRCQEHFRLWLGPAIGPRHFEVGPEVLAAFAHDPSRFQRGRPGHWFADLHGLAKDRIARWVGAQDGQVLIDVFDDPRCTASNAETFFSFRRERHCGRFAAAIWCTGI